MSVQSITSRLLIDLSSEEQQVLTGGQVSTPGGQTTTPGGQTTTPQDGVSSPEPFSDGSESNSENSYKSRRRRFPIRLTGYLYYK